MSDTITASTPQAARYVCLWEVWPDGETVDIMPDVIFNTEPEADALRRYNNLTYEQALGYLKCEGQPDVLVTLDGFDGEGLAITLAGRQLSRS